MPLHRYFDEIDRSNFPGAERVHRNCVSIPIYPALTDKEIERIIVAVRDFFKGR
jgi:dTDP-4-amino-4,6-dideoxygalactose transaminase